MTLSEDDLRAVFRAHDEDIDPATTRDYASIVPRTSRSAWPLLAAAVAVGVSVIILGAYLVWPTSETERPPAAESVPLGGDPARLVSAWKVTDSSEAHAGVLTLGSHGLTISRSCGSLHGALRASASGLFVADLSWWSSACSDEAELPPWLASASAFTFERDNVRLFDAAGASVALLVRVDPSTSPASGESATIATPSGSDHRPVIPAPLEPATPDRLIGRWVPLAVGTGSVDAPVGPFAQFNEDGSWTGSDGCNGAGGRWVANAHGELLSTVGVSTLIGCDGKPIGDWLQDTVAAGFNDEVMVLFDTLGQEVARLERAPSP